MGQQGLEVHCGRGAVISGTLRQTLQTLKSSLHGHTDHNLLIVVLEHDSMTALFNLIES